MKCTLAAVLVLVAVFLLHASAARASTPCCGITAISLSTGIVTARENSSGRMFEFKVTDEKLLQSLKVGEGVYANFVSGQVSVDGVHACCKIVSLDPQPPSKNPSEGKLIPASCCGITAIDAKTEVVTGKVNQTGQTFTFELDDRKSTSQLHLGEGVYANFATKQVSLDGRTPNGHIIDGPTSSAGTGTTTTSPAATAFQQRGGNLLSATANFGSVVSAQGCLSNPSGSDLLIMSLGFDSTRHASYIVANCGHAPTQLPFVVDLFFNGTRADTIEHPILPALSQVTVISQVGQEPNCNPITLRAVADSQNIVGESNESNNELTRALTPPCPDLAFDEIKQDWQDLNTIYSIQVTVANRGTGPTTKTVTIRANLTPSGVTMPLTDQHDLPPLAAGQKYTYHLPGTYALTTSVAVDIKADIFDTITESNRGNNYVHKILGPH